MATNDTHSDTVQEPYATFETDDGQTVLYDRDNPSAWLQSDTMATVED